MAHWPVFVDSSVDKHCRYKQQNQEDYCQYKECNGTFYKDGWKKHIFTIQLANLLLFLKVIRGVSNVGLVRIYI